MRRTTLTWIFIGSMVGAMNAVAAPEMRCRLSGAYIKVYGKDEGEQKTVCERQGGEFTRYVPTQSRSGGPDPRGQAMDSIFGQRSRADRQ